MSHKHKYTNKGRFGDKHHLREKMTKRQRDYLWLVTEFSARCLRLPTLSTNYRVKLKCSRDNINEIHLVYH